MKVFCAYAIGAVYSNESFLGPSVSTVAYHP